MTTKIEQIIEKIKKLSAKANDAATTEAEAAMFAAKVQEMLVEHNLEMADINVEETPVPVDSEEYITPYGHIKWRGLLLMAVAKLYFCKMYRHGSWELDRNKKFKKHYNFMIVGKVHNREVVKSMYDYLCKTVVRLSRDYSSVPLERYHFENGCGIRLYDRVNELVTQAQSKVPTAANTSNLPALYKTELALVDDFMVNIDLKQSKKTSMKITHATLAGQEAANGISLNNQVAGANSKYLLK